MPLPSRSERCARSSGSTIRSSCNTCDFSAAPSSGTSGARSSRDGRSSRRSAVRHDTWIDRAAMLVALGGVSMPSFWLGLLLILIFSLQLGWLPATGQGGFSRLLLPAATIGLNYSAVIARLVRSSLLEVLGNGYIGTARAKGLSEWAVTLKHALGNALIPVTTIIGVQLGNLLAGTIIVETVFSRRGMGRLAVTPVLDKDYPLIQGVVLVSALGYVP